MSLDPDVRALLERPNIVHIATLLKNGGPHVTAAWAGVVDDDRVAFFTEAGSLKARNLARDPRIAFSIVDADNAYRTAHLRGHVVETREGDAAMAIVDELSRRYTGETYEERSGFVALICAIDRSTFADYS